MPNPNPIRARQAKKRRGKPGNLQDLLFILWGAILEADKVLQSTQGDNPELALKAIHALSQSAGQYCKLLEVGEHEARLTAIEQALAQKGTL